MSAIKFRAWLKKEKKIYEVHSIHFGVRHGMGPGDLVDYVELDGKSESYIAGDHLELMQCTELKDKHGREAYEGDIVKLFDRALFVVTWDDYYARFQLELVQGKKELRRVWDMGMLQVGEIIGNRYENPDLMLSQEGGEEPGEP